MFRGSLRRFEGVVEYLANPVTSRSGRVSAAAGEPALDSWPC